MAETAARKIQRDVIEEKVIKLLTDPLKSRSVVNAYIYACDDYTDRHNESYYKLSFDIFVNFILECSLNE